jgi:DNA-binding SARP family transcriptional activator
LPALRKTLEPDLKRGSTYLVREKDSYRLEKGEGGFIDIDCFNDEITAAEKETEEDKSLEKYLSAEKLYGGDLFSEDLYCEWCFHEREKFRKSYLLVLRKIIGLYKEKKEYENCIQFSEKYLEHELFDEKMYASLMSFYAATGNPSMVIRTYEKCRKHIEDELSCPLESATINLFNKLV